MPPPPVCDVYMHWEPSSALPPPSRLAGCSAFRGWAGALVRWEACIFSRGPCVCAVTADPRQGSGGEGRRQAPSSSLAVAVPGRQHIKARRCSGRGNCSGPSTNGAAMW